MQRPPAARTAAYTQSGAARLAHALPNTWTRYLFGASLALLAAEVGALVFLYLFGRVLCALLAMRYGDAYFCPW